MNNNLIKIINNYSEHSDSINTTFDGVNGVDGIDGIDGIDGVDGVDNIIQKIMNSKVCIHYYGNRHNIYIPNNIIDDSDTNDEKLIIGYILLIENGCYNPESWIRNITRSNNEIFYV